VLGRVVELCYIIEYLSSYFIVESREVEVWLVDEGVEEMGD